MKTAIATRFCCSRPLTDLTQLTLMFLTLILQYLNELVERKVRDFTSPEAFHAVKVQRFNRNRIKLLAKFGSEFSMKVFALVGYLPMQAGELPHTPPPTIRTFHFARKVFVETTKFVQGLLQRLWVLFLFTPAKCQIRVFHTEVCPNALTCCRQWKVYRTLSNCHLRVLGFHLRKVRVIRLFFRDQPASPGKVIDLNLCLRLIFGLPPSLSKKRSYAK